MYVYLRACPPLNSKVDMCCYISSRPRPVLTISFTNAKKRRVAETSSWEEGSVGSMSVCARLAQDSDKVFQLGTKQPTVVATVPNLLSESPPSSCAQGGTAEVTRP